jgi:predicted ATPase with chaperone activity
MLCVDLEQNYLLISYGTTIIPQSNTSEYLEVLAKSWEIEKTYISLIAIVINESFLDTHHTTSLQSLQPTNSNYHRINQERSR